MKNLIKNTRKTNNIFNVSVVLSLTTTLLGSTVTAEQAEKGINNNGSQNWSSSWMEASDDGTPGNG